MKGAPVLRGAAPLAEEVKTPTPAWPQRDAPVPVVMVAPGFAVGVEHLVDALDAAGGAPRRADNARRTVLMSAVGRPSVVGYEMLRTEGHPTVFHTAAGTDHGRAPPVRAQGSDVPVGGAVPGRRSGAADVAPLLLAGYCCGPRVVGVGPPPVDDRRAVASGGIVDRERYRCRLPGIHLGIGERSQVRSPPAGAAAAAGSAAAAVEASASGGRWRSPRGEGLRRARLSLADGRSGGLNLLPVGGFCCLSLNDSGGGEVGLPLKFCSGL